MSEAERYKARGVSASKSEVHEAVRHSHPGLYPGAFCKLVPDTLTGSKEHALAMHADTAGTKSVLAYLYYRETGDASVFSGIAQDALVMNLDDLLCVGASGPFLVSNTIGRNARLVPGEVLRAIIGGYEALAQQFSEWGLTLDLTGGETADVGDLVRTVDVGATVVTRLLRTQVIANDRVRPGDVIFGLASDGQATYETAPNSGIGCNGLTSARHDLLIAEYGTRYPETLDPGIPEHLRYCGPHRLTDPLPGSPLTVGKALLSPTRTYAPLISGLLREAGPKVHGLVHCTGGGQTKCLRTGTGIQYVKEALFNPPALFARIQQVTGTPWREMYQVFNMGHRLEVFGEDSLLPVLQDLGRAYGIAVRKVGVCESAPGVNQVRLRLPDGTQADYRLPAP
ncbi:MAG: AIR synthase related protein [Deltaproteobacteria bacterium]|nr:AIR synthase related protein [Deltaproteobacteria bacterium]